MKIGILTLTEGINYGCKLQNYALLYALENLDKSFEVSTINNDTCCGNSYFKRKKQNLKKLIRSPLKYSLDKKKERVFKKYNVENLKITKRIITENNFSQFDQYDAFVCGSDQIWNPNYIPNIKINTAYYANKDTLKISYAASIGVDEIPDNRKEEFYAGIVNMDSVSVREKSGAKLVESIINQKVSVVLDPTLLLERKDWESFESKSINTPNKYILTYFLKGQPESVRNYINTYACKNNLEVINLNDVSQKQWYTISPNEFVYLVHNCKYFFTDSFHGTVFSIIFHKNFWTFHRNSNDKMQKQSGRITTLLDMVGLNNRIITDIENINMNDIDYNGVDEIVSKRREESILYLKKSLKQNNKKINNNKEKCCGCGNCRVVCPVNAISMRQDERGFIYPYVNNDKCINCGKCKKVCPYECDMDKDIMEISKAYCVENKNELIRMSSSSGGIFFLLAKKVIEDGGVVYTPRFDNNFNLKHIQVDSIDELYKCLGSKYVQSNIYNLLEKCKNELDTGRNVLYTGTPCQISALKKYLGKDYENLLTQDLICHGCASNAYFKKYLKWLECKNNSVVNSFNFRNKSTGWNKYSISVSFENGKSMTQIANQNNYFALYLRKYIMRLSCYECVFRKRKRESDITLGDFWGIDKHDNKGTSLVLVHSKKGLNLLKSIEKDTQRFEEINYYDSINKNPAYFSNISKPDDLSKFIKDSNKEFDYLYNKYVKGNLIKKIKRKFLNSK